MDGEFIIVLFILFLFFYIVKSLGSAFFNYSTLKMAQENVDAPNKKSLAACVSDAATLQRVYFHIEAEINKLKEKVVRLERPAVLDVPATCPVLPIENAIKNEGEYFYESLDVYQKQRENRDGRYYNVYN